MATTDGVTKALGAVEQNPLKKLIEDSCKELGRALPAHMRPERLVRIALTCIRTNPELASTTQESLLGALFTAAQIGLEPVAGRSYLLPFNNKRKVGTEWKTVKETQLVIGYKGLIELFFRHESALSIDMQRVHEKDELTYQYGTEAYLHHKPASKDRGSVIGYYAVAKIKGGGSVFFYMSKQDALDHGKKHSKTYDKIKGEFYYSSPWAKEEDAMGLKTVLIQLSKRLPLSIELQRAIEADETSRDYRRGIESALDITPTTNWTEEEFKPEAKVPYEPGADPELIPKK